MTNGRLIDRGINPQRMKKDHCAHGLAGCVQIKKNRKTGARIGVYDSVAQGIDSEFPWACVCEDHGTCVCCETLVQAKRTAAFPDWCEECSKKL